MNSNADTKVSRKRIGEEKLEKLGDILVLSQEMERGNLKSLKRAEQMSLQVFVLF